MTVDYNVFLDKVKGCFLGKTVIGTLGAPFEGVKMPMEMPFKPEMVDTMLPNDDLDLQVIWLEVVEKKGLSFTSYDLLEAFCENCAYSPGEYAIMRKNFEKGIYPPLSGKFCNDFYRGGMGCPIRSEIWACLSPGDAVQAAELAGRDGVLDHEGESVYAEKYFAAVESFAFFESDIRTLLMMGLCAVPRSSKVRELVEFVLAECEKRDNIKDVLTEILYRYGHPDCTNMLQNIGITLASLIFGGGDILKTGRLALNCGFDTDCTCASAGALLGIVLGEERIREQYGWQDIKYVLGVKAHRRSDLVSDLAEDVARLAVFLSGTGESNVDFKGAPPAIGLRPEKDPLTFTVEYDGDDPTVGPDKNGLVKVILENNTDEPVDIMTDFVFPENIELKAGRADGDAYKRILPHETLEEILEIGVADRAGVIYEKNNILVRVTGDVVCGFRFGVSGNKIWRLTGPVWSTVPATNEEILSKVPSYWHVLPPARTEAESIDNVRRFHLNFARDTQTDIFTEEELFAPSDGGREFHGSGGAGIIARPYKVRTLEIPEDSFTVDGFFGFKGPCVVYMSQILVAPEDMTVYAQLGYSSPFKFFVNGKLVGERHDADTWDAENAHFAGIELKKGENRIVLRLTRLNADAKYSLIFSQGATCSTHYCCFVTRII